MLQDLWYRALQNNSAPEVRKPVKSNETVICKECIDIIFGLLESNTATVDFNQIIHSYESGF